MDERPDGRLLNKLELVAGEEETIGQTDSMAFLASSARNARLTAWPSAPVPPATNTTLFKNLPSGLSSIRFVLCFFASCPFSVHLKPGSIKRDASCRCWFCFPFQPKKRMRCACAVEGVAGGSGYA